MLEQLVEQRWVVSAVLAEEQANGSAGKKIRDLTPTQWDLAAQLLDALRPFKAATTFLSAVNNVSVSCLLPIIVNLRDRLKDKRKEMAAACNFKNGAVTDLTRRWGLDDFCADAIPVLAAALDPHFKKMLLIGKSELTAVMKATVAQWEAFSSAHKLVSEDHDKPRGKTTFSEADPAAASDGPSVKKKKPENPLDFLFGPEKSAVEESIEEELACYFTDPTISKSANPLDWWRSNAQRYPRVAILARFVLCTPATSTLAEHIFSAAGNIVKKKRAALLPSDVDALIFLNKNWELLFSSSAAGPELHEVTQEELDIAENPPLPNI